ncbi:hypothetical protein I3679_004370 [Proteus mirabilis]|uniref:Fimbrial subunit n=1 Tax=Proteus mirabilis TaxID=584 RepID=A0ABD5LR29_PROMI
MITSGIITTKDKCIFNNGSPITFDFGNVGNTSDYLNGQNYKITLATSPSNAKGEVLPILIAE